MILLIDNYDSFTYNIYDYLQQCHAEVVLYRNNEIELAEIEKIDPQAIVFSPGPGKPKDHELMFRVLERYYNEKPILGVCLGQQAIAEAFGGTLYNLKQPMHGIATPIKVTDYNEQLFQGLPHQFKVGRYHSWVVDEKSLPDVLTITAVDERDNSAMALRHKFYDVRGVQFHPESILTEFGKEMMQNWLALRTETIAGELVSK